MHHFTFERPNVIISNATFDGIQSTRARIAQLEIRISFVEIQKIVQQFATMSFEYKAGNESN